MKFFVALLALGIPLMVQGYSSGAPAGQCGDMTPKHGVDGQRGQMPYDIILSKKSIRSGDTVDVTIKGRKNDDLFKGLMVEARVGNEPIGKFDVSQSRQYIQTLDCGNSRGNAVTHKKIEEGVHEVKFRWTAPAGLRERVTFYATVAKNGGVFWIAQKSEVLSIN